MTQTVLYSIRIYPRSACAYIFTPPSSPSVCCLETLYTNHLPNDLGGKHCMYFTGLVIVVMHIPQRRLNGASVVFSRCIRFPSARSLYTTIHVHGYWLTPNQRHSPFDLSGIGRFEGGFCERCPFYYTRGGLCHSLSWRIGPIWLRRA